MARAADTNLKVTYVTCVLMGPRRYNDQAYSVNAGGDMPNNSP